jgi:sugar O-acyltransferase (sialic acid O-acetyltransferase NeuD family)
MAEPKKLIIYGAGDLGREIMYAAMEQHSEFGRPCRTAAFIDDAAEKQGGRLEGVKVLSLNAVLESLDSANHLFISGIGNAAGRMVSINELAKRIPQAQFASVVHRSAVIMPTVTMGPGVYVGANATIGIGCSLQGHSVVNFNCSIGHDTALAPFAVISPGCILSGRTTIGRATFLGSGVISYPGVCVGSRCLVSAGAVIARSIPDNTRIIEKPNTMQLPLDKTSSP